MATTYTESFESNFGSWSNITQFSTTGWARRTGGTPSGSTGPSSAQSGSYYIFVETSSGSSNTSGNTDIIQYNLPSSETDGYVSFYYNQYGIEQGTLHLEAYTGSSWTSLWSSTGNQGTSWINITNRTFSGATAIRFRNVAAGGFRGDIALDNITVYSEEPVLNNIYFGSARLTPPDEIYWGSTRVNKVYFGNTAIYEDTSPSEWTYIGTSGSYNSTASFQNSSYFSCPASGTQQTIALNYMNATYSPSSYSSGHIFRVSVYVGDGFPGTFCGYRYFRAD